MAEEIEKTLPEFDDMEAIRLMDEALTTISKLRVSKMTEFDALSILNIIDDFRKHPSAGPATVVKGYNHYNHIGYAIVKLRPDLAANIFKNGHIFETGYNIVDESLTVEEAMSTIAAFEYAAKETISILKLLKDAGWTFDGKESRRVCDAVNINIKNMKIFLERITNPELQQKLDVIVTARQEYVDIATAP